MTMNTKPVAAKNWNVRACPLGNARARFAVVEAKECIEPRYPHPDLVVSVRYGDKKKTLLVEIKSSGEELQGILQSLLV